MAEAMFWFSQNLCKESMEESDCNFMVEIVPREEQKTINF